MLSRLVYRFLHHFIASRRPPDQIIGGIDAPYMLRWWVFGGIPADHPKARVGSNVGATRAPRRPFGLTLYLHCFLRSDDDRALHDHPWDWWSWILRGGYVEVIPLGADGIHQMKLRKQGTLRRGKAAGLHRVQLLPRQYTRDNVMFRRRSPLESEVIGIVNWPTQGEAVWTLFGTGRLLRSWGFQCEKGWVPWREFVIDPNDPDNPNARGPGCGAIEVDR